MMTELPFLVNLFLYIGLNMEYNLWLNVTGGVQGQLNQTDPDQEPLGAGGVDRRLE